MTGTNRIHQFSVRARHIDRHHARVLAEPSFEAAAIAYVEHFVPLAGDAAEISLVVRNLETGHEHCFRVDLDTGEAQSCG